MDIISIGTAIGFSIFTNLAKKATSEESLTKVADWILSAGEYFWKRAKKTDPENEQPPKSETIDPNTPTPSIDFADFATERRINQIASLMEQLNTYSSNLNKDLERAAKLGGIDSPDMTHRLFNSIQDQKKAISQCFLQLINTVHQLYGEKIDELRKFKKLVEDQI